MADANDPADLEGRAKRQVERIRTEITGQNRKDLLKTIKKGRRGRLGDEGPWAASTVRNNARALRILANDITPCDLEDECDQCKTGEECDRRAHLANRIVDNDAEALNTYLEDLAIEREWSGGTERNYAMALRNLCKAVGQPDKADAIEYPSIDHQTAPVDTDSVLTREELIRMIETTDHPRNKALLAVMWESACRATAIASLKLKHYQPRGNSYAILRLPGEHVEGLKRAEHGAKPLTFSRGYVDQWLNEHPARDNPEAALFCGTRSQDDPTEHLRSHTIYKTAKRIADETEGVDPDRVTAHAFKHGRGTEMRQSDEYGKEDIEQVMDWEDGTPLHQRYEHVTEEDEAVRILRKRGFEVEESEPVAEETDCPKCGTVVPGPANYCPTCGLRQDDTPPRWWRIYREITDEDDPIRRQYQDDLPPQSLARLTPDAMNHVSHKLHVSSIATMAEQEGEFYDAEYEVNTDIPLMDSSDAEWIEENIVDINREHLEEYPAAARLREDRAPEAFPEADIDQGED